MSKWFFVFIVFIVNPAFSQYAPSAGEIGTTAISKDSSVFLFWADSCKIVRGWQNSSNKELGYASLGVEIDAIGLADGKVVSLGDSGQITLSFPHRIENGVGFDFAIFENSFNNTFLELAFVEVSSDGKHYVRFPAVSFIPSVIQLGNDAIMDADKIDNLAGKYRGGYGTPFDLENLKDTANLDLQNIRFVRLVDVVGSINPIYGTKDSKGNIINDPFPTPYPSAGFDLDAVGVINSNFASISEKTLDIKIWPNPASEFLYIDIDSNEVVQIINAVGKCEFSKELNGISKIDVSLLDEGIYFVRINNSVQKIKIQ
jgi:hypothetical protein